MVVKAIYETDFLEQNTSEDYEKQSNCHRKTDA